MKVGDQVDAILNDRFGPPQVVDTQPRKLTVRDRVDEILGQDAPAPPPKNQTRGRVSRVVDGDTLEVEGIGRIRLRGLDTPEVYGQVESGGPRASAYMKHLAEGKDVNVELLNEKDKYGRNIAHVYSADGKQSLAAEMLDAGLADTFKGLTPARTPVALRDGEAAAAAVKGTLAGLVRGLIYPVSAFVPSYYRQLDIDVLQSKSTMSKFMQAKGIGDERTQVWITATPSLVGEMAGSLIPGMGAYGIARKAFGVADAVTMASKATRTLGAAAASGTMFSVAADLDDGQSRLAHVAYNTALNVGFETLAIPLLRRAWKMEIKDTAAKGITEAVAEKLGVQADEADDVITAVRTGIAPKEVKAATAIVEAIRDKHPDAIGSTVDIQAKKILDTWVTQILPDAPPRIDPGLKHMFPNYGVSFDIMVGDKRIAQHIESNPNDIPQFNRDLGKLRQQMYEWSAGQGVPVKIDNVRAHSQASYNRFVNFLYGKEGSGAPPLRTVPGAAPEGSLAYKGADLTPGTQAVDAVTGQTVTIINPPGTPGRTGTSIQPPLEAPADRGGSLPPTHTGVPRQADLPPAPEVQLPPQTRNAQVWVRDSSGKSVQKKLTELKPFLDLAQAGRPILSQFRAHPDGMTRHGFINLHNGTVEIEPVGNYSEGYFRHRYFYQQDPQSQMVDMPRLFVHGDGTATIAVAPTTTVRKEPLFANRLEGGPMDSIEARQHIPYNEAQLLEGAQFARANSPNAGPGMVAEQVSPGSPRAYLKRSYEPGQPDEVRTGGTFRAGFNPRKMEPKDQFGRPQDPNYGQATAVVREPLSANRDFKYYGEARQLGRDATSDPHLVTARDAARVLLRKGMSPDTRINVRLTPASFAYAPEEQASWTLRDLVNQEFGLTDLSYLQEEASYRGMKATPKGKGIILEATDGSYKKEFPSQVEALEAVGRLSPAAEGPKIERELERVWGYGFERSFDADIDSDIYRPVEFMESGVKELMVGRRPLVTVWGAADDTGTAEGNLRSAVEGLAKSAGLNPQAFTVLPLPVPSQRGRAQYAIFNDLAVRQMLGRFAPALKHVGVDIQPSIDETLRRLAAKKHGLAFLYGGDRDPMDSLLYTYLRERGEKELWSKAEVSVDALGPYRKFSTGIRDEVKRRNAAKMQQTNAPLGVRVMQPLEAPAEGPAGGGTWKDLMDEAPTPDDFYMTPRDGDGPPPMGEIDPGFIDDGGEILNDTSSPISKVWNRFRIPQEMFKYLEEHTKVPFYQWYQSIEAGRGRVEAATKEHFGQLAKLARPLNREDRKRVQLLLETKHQDSKAFADMQKTVGPHIQAAADALEGIYTDFYTKLGYSPDDVAKTLGNFPQIRQSGKTYKVWTRGRAGLPKPMVDLAGAADNGWAGALETGAVNLDERDLNFHTIARRMMRASANAKHLRPVWDDVDHALKVFSSARGSSTEVSNYFQYFDRYRREALHQPDELAKSLHNFTAGTWKRLFGQTLPDDEVVDLVSTMTSFNYYANMAFQVGMVGRNYLQTLQTTFPAIGAKHTGSAIRWALKWRKDPHLQEEMMQYGVIARDAYVEPLRDVQRLIAESNATSGLGSAPAKIMDALDSGVRWYQSADNFNRVVAWRAQYTKAKEAADDFLAKKITWSDFIEKSGAESRVEGWDTGLGINVKEALTEQGNADLAASLLAQDFATASQFLYTRGNVPFAMQSTLGRLFGQYGTWPAYYIEFMANSLRRGSPRAKAEFLGRWTAANAAVFYGVGNLFGADMARWTFLAPTSYTGGPVAQFAQQAMAAYNQQVTGEDDPVSRIQSTRLQRFATTQVLPIPVGAMRNYYNALNELGDENYAEATRRFLGLPKMEGGGMQLPPPFGR